MTRRIGTYDHPERREGEVFIGYYTAQAAQFVPYATKRLGLATDDDLGEAADPHGTKNSDNITHPLFMLEVEARKKKLDLNPPLK